LAKVVAIVGAETLLGREVREVLEATHLDITLRLLNAEDETEGQIVTREDDDLVTMERLTAESLQGADAVVLAARALEGSSLARKTQVLDLTGDLPAAAVMAPMVLGPQPVKGPVMIAHPAAIAIGLLMARLPAAPARSVVEVFEPASERGKDGVAELQQQTINLLSFKPLPQAVFDTQASLNLLAAYGEGAPRSLAQVEERIVHHLGKLLGGRPMPSLRVLHAPVFHGVMLSAWIEFPSPVSREDLEKSLENELVDLRRQGVELPANVGVAGQTGIMVSITEDRQNSNAYWFWVGADNLRLVADNAMVVLTSLFGRGRVN
jgi:aspartate-semialdehyde dehydrogenase